MEHNAISRFDVGDLRSHLTNDTTTFLTQKVWKISVWAFDGINFSNLRATDSADNDFDQHLTECQRRNLDFVNFEGLRCLNEDGGKSLHLGYGWNPRVLGFNDRNR
jgi:hypothetical protein